LVAQITAGEIELLKYRERSAATAYRTAVITELVSAFLGLVIVAAFVWLLHRNQQVRESAAGRLYEERERFRTTLTRIGDAVLTTDREGRVTFLNGVAESLTGWTQDEATGKPLETIFRVLNEQTREPVDSPAERALQKGIVTGLANHSLLIARDGTERP